MSRAARYHRIAAVIAFALAAGSCSPAAVAAPAQRATGYQSIVVKQPPGGTTLFDNSGNMDVAVAVAPELDTAAGDRIALIVDGRMASLRAATQFRLSGIARGEHTLEAQVRDSAGNVLISSNPVKFQMWQASRLFPNRHAN